jgi:hypothetical protein
MKPRPRSSTAIHVVAVAQETALTVAPLVLSWTLEVTAVLGDRAVGGVPVELEPAEIFLDGLRQRDLRQPCAADSNR